MHRFEEIRALLARVRRRWRAQRAFQAAVRVALAASLVVAVAMVVARFTTGAPIVLVATALTALGLVVAGAVWGTAPLRGMPDDRQVARFIEEHDSSLDDRLVSAVDVAEHPSAAAGLAEPMLADAAKRLRDLDIETILPREAVRRGGFQAAAATLVLIVLIVSARHTIRQAFDATALVLFPSRVTLDVTPGNARIKAGSALSVQARLVGNLAPVAAQLQIAAGDNWRSAEMSN